MVRIVRFSGSRISYLAFPRIEGPKYTLSTSTSTHSALCTVDLIHFSCFVATVIGFKTSLFHVADRFECERIVLSYCKVSIVN